MIEETELIAIVVGLGVMALCVALGWWLRARASCGVALDLYCKIGGLWHKGAHYDVRKTEPTYGWGPEEIKR